MELIIGEWVGKTVSVKLKVGGMASPVTIEGKLINVGTSGVLVELAKGRTFVPIASILHISLLNTT